MRPEEVTVSVFDGATPIEETTLSSEDEWKKVYHGVLESHEYHIECSDVDNYTYEIDETTAIYTLEIPEAPTIEEQLAEITEFLMQLDERVYILEGGE